MLHLLFMGNSMLNPNNYMAVYSDFAMFFTIFLVFSFLIASVLQKKTYFKYNVEGLRAIRALREILLYVMAILVCIPYANLFPRTKSACS